MDEWLTDPLDVNTIKKSVRKNQEVFHGLCGLGKKLGQDVALVFR